MSQSILRQLFAIIISLALMAIPVQSQAANKIDTVRPAASNRIFKDCPNCPEMVVVPPGSFEMGSNKGADESPVHRVTIDRAFALGKIKVTQGQWKEIMGNNPSDNQSCGDHCPVDNVSWSDAQEFIRKLNARTGKQYRLPSEAEWEYACRAGHHQEYCGGDNVDSVAWYAGNSGNAIHASAAKRANAWGLYDMSGNIWEWVEDSWHDSYHGAPADGSAWQGDGVRRVLRSGAWYLMPHYVRAASRSRVEPVSREYGLGFRVARTLP
ncbi:MAG: formylglycine-generating enzyme family protein [Pseudomonadota bacterium]